MKTRFDFYTSPTPNPDKKAAYHARITHGRTVGTDELAQEICEQTSFTEGDVKGMLAVLHNKLVEKLSQGNRVSLDGIGVFRITLQCGEIEEPKPHHTQEVGFKSVKFQADSELKKTIANRLELVREPDKRHSPKIDDATVPQQLESFFASHDFATRRDVEQLFGVTRTMAVRLIKKWIDSGILQNKGTRQNPVYMLLK